MKIELTPQLRVERDLYKIPHGRERFERYIEAMTGGTSDIVAPLAFMNPMGKEHVAATLDALIALDAEGIAETAVFDARRRLASIQGRLRVALVVADDAGGGWTDRYLTEVKQRFENDAEPKRGWAVALFWTSEVAEVERIRTEVLAAVYRATWIRGYGVARTLSWTMEQEGFAACFAGSPPASLSAEEFAQVSAVIAPHRGSTQRPIQFACLYGDEAATAVGYPPLGLPPRAGFALALHEATRRRIAPEDLLLASQAVEAQTQRMLR